MNRNTYSIILALLITAFCGSKTHAQSIQAKEQMLLDKFNVVDSLDLVMTTENRMDIQDSMDVLNNGLVSFFVSILKSKEAMNYGFDNLGIKISASPDKKLRLFSWDTHLGGTAANIRVIAQFEGANGIIYAEDLGQDVIYDTVYQIKSRDSIIYIVVGTASCASMCVTKELTVFCITGGWLHNDNRIIDKVDFKNQLQINYTNDASLKWDPEYIVDTKKRKILEPIIDEGVGKRPKDIRPIVLNNCWHLHLSTISYLCLEIISDMTYIVIDTSDKQSEAFLQFVKTLPFAKIQKGANATTIKAMENVKKGKVTKHKNVKELISFLNK